MPLQQFCQHLRYLVHANNIHMIAGDFSTNNFKEQISHNHLQEFLHIVKAATHIS